MMAPEASLRANDRAAFKCDSELRSYDEHQRLVCQCFVGR